MKNADKHRKKLYDEQMLMDNEHLRIEKEQLLLSRKQQLIEAKRAKLDKVNMLISILTLIATLATCTFLILQVREMQRATDRPYKPSLIIDDKNLTIERFYMDDMDYGIKYNDNQPLDLYFELRNIGAGVARNITYVWDPANYQLLWSWAEKLENQYHDFKIDRDSINTVYEHVTIQIDNNTLKVDNLKEPDKVSYLRPSKEIENADKIMVDASAYIQLFGVIGNLTSNRHDIVPPLPEQGSLPLRINVNYEDVFGTEYHSVIRIDIMPKDICTYDPDTPDRFASYDYDYEYYFHAVIEKE